MKSMFLLPVFTFFSVYAQPVVSSVKREPERKDPYEINSGKLRMSDNLILAYKFTGVPEKRVPPGNRTGKYDSPSRMPVITIRKFNSNMPIMVPDSSVHYYLKIKKIEGNYP